MIGASHGEGDGTPLQHSCLDRGAWWAAVHGVAEGQTWLSDFTFTFHFHVLEKEMATYSIVLAWRIPGTGKPGGLPSMGSHRVGHDWGDLAAAAAVCVYVHPKLLIHPSPFLPFGNHSLFSKNILAFLWEYELPLYREFNLNILCSSDILILICEKDIAENFNSGMI